jgi:hypothetical protein
MEKRLINAKVDKVLKRNEIDQATIFGQSIEGNGACKLMEKYEATCNKMEEHVLQAPTGVAGTGEDI